MLHLADAGQNYVYIWYHNVGLFAPVQVLNLSIVPVQARPVVLNVRRIVVSAIFTDCAVA